MSEPEKIHWTQDELIEEAKRRFGPDPKQWKFTCPQCGDVACAQDFYDADVPGPEITPGQDCIGRKTGALARSGATNSRGCDWCAYGLFRGPWLVTLPDGKEVGSFRLAEADHLTLPDGKQYAGRLTYDEMGKPRVDTATCGECGFSWNDALMTQLTPAPAGRCPNEYGHVYGARQ